MYNKCYIFKFSRVIKKKSGFLTTNLKIFPKRKNKPKTPQKRAF